MGAGGSMQTRGEGKGPAEFDNSPASDLSTTLPSLGSSFQSESDSGVDAQISHIRNRYHSEESTYPCTSESSDAFRIGASTSMMACQRARLYQQCEEPPAEEQPENDKFQDKKKHRRKQQKVAAEEPYFLSEQGPQRNEEPKLELSFVSIAESEPVDPDGTFSESLPLAIEATPQSNNRFSSEKSTTRKPSSPSMSVAQRRGGLTRDAPSMMVVERRARIHESRIHDMERDEQGRHEYQHQYKPSSGSAAIPKTRSLPSLHRPRDDRGTRDALCGFKVGDRVSVSGGLDAKGPWEGMGDGIVHGPDPRKGFLSVYFEARSETFSIKASNLRDLTKLSRSSSRTLAKRSSSSSSQGTVVGIMMGGLEIGDLVSDHCLGGFATVLGEGSIPGTVTVRYADTHFTRCAKVTDLVKHRRVEKKQIVVVQEREPEKIDHYKGLVIGDFVKSTKNDGWTEMGIGCIRGFGDTVGTFRVQFDNGGSTWVIKAKDLRKEATPQKSFRAPGCDKNSKTQTIKSEEKIDRKVKKREEQRLKKDGVLAMASRPEVTTASLKNLVLENNRAEGHHQTSYG